MAAVLMATPIVRSKAMRSEQAFFADVGGGVPAQKRLRVSCRQAAASSGRVRSDVVAEPEVHVFQPSSAQDTLSDWIVNFLLKEDVVPEQAAAAAPEPAVVVAPKLLQVVAEPALEATSKPAQRRRKPVVFTEEMARRLRKENRATQTFHDKWYHSAIASRLATPAE